MRLMTLSLVFASLLSGQSVFQGTVTDTDGETLPGVQVFLKDTYVGTTTSMEGEFKIALPEQSGVLVFSYIGYETQEVHVSSDTPVPISVEMTVDVLKGDEVLVTGLASSVKRRNAANAVASVSGEELVGAPVQTLDAALNGKFAGVRVRHNSGAPGGGMSVNLRGVSTITGETQPLYVIDGVVVNNSTNQSGIDVVSAATGAGSARPQGQPANRISDFNPNDIESLEVLKGASAAAIYGAKATNGVIIITTKKGQAGKTRVNFSQKFGSSSAMKKVGTREFTYQKAVDQFGASVADQGTRSGDGFKTYDYENMLYGNTGALKETSVSMSGGSDKTQFYLSTQYLDEKSIVKNRFYERFSGRLNMNHRVSDRFKIASTAYLARTKSDRGITGNDNTNKSYNFSFANTPNFVDIRQNSDGSWPDHPTNSSNPLHTVDVLTNEETVNRATGSVSADYTVFRSGSSSFSLNSVFSGDYVGQVNEIFSPPELQDEKVKDNPGQSVLSNTHSLNTNVNLNGVFRTTFGDMKSTTTSGVSYETLDWNYSSIMAAGMVVTQTNIDQSASTSTIQSRRFQQDRGIFVQEEIQVGDAVYVAASMRGDKSSTLGKTDEYNWYPKVAGSYQFGSMAGVFDNLKVRLAYGQTGNLPPPTAKYTSMAPSNIGGMGGLVSGGVAGFEDVEPERTTETEFGVDFSAFDKMVGVEFTVYNQSVDGLLLQVEEAPSTGFSTKWANAGSMKTDGVELGVTLNPVRSKRLNWLSKTTYYASKAEITELKVDPYNTGGFATFLGAYRIEKGWDPHTIVGAELDANGKHVKLGNESPDFMMGFNNRVSFGDFSVVSHFDWKKGGQNVNLQELIADLGGTSVDYDDTDVDPEGKLSNGAYRTGNLGSVTRPYVQDAGYFRLSELSLMYNVPKSMMGSANVDRVQVGFTGRNLYQSTPYTGWNPDVSQFGNVGVGGSIDTGPYPLAKSMYLTVNVSF